MTRVDEGDQRPLEDADREAFDQARIMAEIEAEARRLRQENIVSVSFERELDTMFGRLAPPAAAEDFESSLASAEELAYVDPHAPVLSSKRAGSALKRFVRKAVFFYGSHLTTQVTAFSTTMARAVRLLGRRVDAVEAALPSLSARARDELPESDAGERGSPWAAQVATTLAGVTGRVAVGECGTGAVVRALVDRGVDGYGIEPTTARADAASRAGLEVREAQVLDHLRLVPPSALGAVVLIGCVDRLALGAQLELFDRAAQALAPNGVLAIITEVRSVASATESPMEIDLAPGRPLHPATWAHLLGAHGFEDVVVTAGEAARVFEHVPGATETATVLNRNLDRLDDLLAGPRSALVVGRRAAR